MTAPLVRLAPRPLSPSPLGIAQAAVRGIQGVVVGSQRGPGHGSRCRQGGPVCRFTSPRPEPPPTLKQPQTQTFESKAPLPETSTEAVPSSGSAVPRQWWGRGGAANRGGRSGGHWHNRNCPQWLRASSEKGGRSRRRLGPSLPRPQSTSRSRSLSPTLARLGCAKKRCTYVHVACQMRACMPAWRYVVVVG